MPLDDPAASPALFGDQRDQKGSTRQSVYNAACLGVQNENPGEEAQGEAAGSGIASVSPAVRHVPKKRFLEWGKRL